jgi:glyoxylase-like metal-dependent hydrolase (beta-lactamase superfamily II)
MIDNIRTRRVLALVLGVLSWTACGDRSSEESGIEELPLERLGTDAAESPWAPEAPDSVHRLVRRIGEDVYTYEFARPEDPVTTVSMFVVTDDGVLVADGQGNVEETELLLAEIARVTDRPVTHLVVASDHGDHSGGNLAFPESVEVYAHPFAAEALAPATPGDPALLPDHLVAGREQLVLGGRRIEILFLGRGHTAGDLVVHLPEERLLFMSEAFLDRVFPLMVTAYPSEWVETLGLAEAMDVDTYVAGHGVRGSIDYSRENLVRYRGAVEQVITEVQRLWDAGLTADEAVEQANFGALALQADYVYQAERAVRRVWAELSGELPSQ